MTEITEEKRKRHQQRMQQRKAIINAKVAKATEDRGVVIVLTGNGKGKSSSGFGTIVRCLGHNYKAGVVQFIKGTWECGERNFLENTPGLEFYVMGTDFTWETQDAELDRAAAEKVWLESEHLFRDPEVRLVLLDEITYVLNYKYLDRHKVIDAIRNRPLLQSVIITGRGAKKYLLDLADTVSEINAVKHAFEDGIKAQKGIEW